MGKIVEVVAALIIDNDKFLICRRPSNKSRPLMWEFVGGKVEIDESKIEAIIRECREELAISIKVNSLITTVQHQYPDITINLSLYNCSIVGGNLTLLEHVDAKWITVDEVNNFDFCPADQEMLEIVCKQF